MPNRPYDLPSSKWLVSFEAAARNASFKLAAAELGVTPAAISHQVKALESDLNCELFHRFHRGVELTESGAYLLVSLQRAFEGINESLSQLRAQHRRSSVTIGSTPAVSSLWLTPRLAEFWKSHGHISVAQIVSDMPLDTPACDISVAYGDMARETLPCSHLFHGNISILASPKFAENHKVQDIQDMSGVPLIQLADGLTEWMNWQQWSKARDFKGTLNIEHRVNNYAIALQAAQDDMGAVLGWHGLTTELLESGKLVRLLPDSVNTQLGFYLKLHNENSSRVRRVFDWLAANVAKPA